jgi:group I intron endonuclease
MKRAGIYRILNKVNGKCYIGSSSDVRQRISRHKHDLKKNWHENSHLQNAWNRYGEHNFKFIILLFCKQKVLIEKEQQMIDFYSAYTKGYNLCPAAGSCLGLKRSEESKEKMKGNVNGKGNKGRVTSKRTRLKQRKAKLGKSSGMKGKHHSTEAKIRMSVKKIGRPSPRKGVRLSEKIILNMSLSHQGHNKGMIYKK